MKKGKDGKKTHTKELLATLFAVVVLGFLYLYVLVIIRPSTSPSISQDTSPVGENTSTLPTSVSGLKKYRSDFMKIEFEYPIFFAPKEGINSVLLTSDKSQIEIEKQAVNFNNLNEYFNYFASKRNNIVDNRAVSFNGNNYRVVELLVENNKIEYVLMTLANYNRYTFSTKDPSLFSDLETIAKSFRIID